ncbi:MAG: TonB family protein [bacterium]
MKRQKTVIIPIIISLLLHLIFFAVFSLDALWPLSVSARKPLALRILSVDRPKPKDILPPDPDSRNLSDANRRESGEKAPSPNPRLRRELEEAIAGRRGTPAPPVRERFASLPPVPDAPRFQVSPLPPAPPREREPEEKVEEAPAEKIEEAPEEKREAPESPRAEDETPPEGESPPPEPKVKVRRPDPAPLKEAPRPVEEARPAPPPPEPSPETPPEEKTPPPEKSPPKKKPVRKTPPEEKSPPKPRPRVVVRKSEKRAPPPPPADDPLAMFRTIPRRRGQPAEPNLDLTDEEAEKFAKRARQENLAKEEGDVVSLDTRNYKYASYFAHIKERIQRAWSWPMEARGYGGQLKLKFVLREDGRLHRLELLSSSGYRILDDAAVSAVTKAGPFKPFPPGFNRKLLPIEGSFIYERRGFFGTR